MSMFRWLARGCLPAGTCLLAFVLFCSVVAPSITAVLLRSSIVDPLKDAKSVKLVHFLDTGKGRIVYSTRELEPKDFHLVSESIPLRPDLGCWGIVDF